ncbi:hypothetical protein D8W73_08435 [Citrobacter amalonaticus]|nr:hypothetical protein [Citrobacter amalonaticus]
MPAAGPSDSWTAPKNGWLLPPVKLQTKKEKAWFFLLCGYKTKINKLIFLVFNEVLSACLVSG